MKLKKMQKRRRKGIQRKDGQVARDTGKRPNGIKCGSRSTVKPENKTERAGFWRLHALKKDR
jgi:hypothetical protein